MRGAILAAATLVLFTACEGNSAETPPLSGEPKDGGILFSSKRDGDFEIYLMDPDGSDVRQLTRNESQGENEADDGSPSWSPDGRRIAFTSTSDHEGDGFDSEELYVMEADGAGQTRLTENESGEGGPSWSPDGEWLVFARRAVEQPATEKEALKFKLELMRTEGVGDENAVRARCAPRHRRLMVAGWEGARIHRLRDRRTPARLRGVGGERRRK